MSYSKYDYKGYLTYRESYLYSHTKQMVSKSSTLKNQRVEKIIIVDSIPNDCQKKVA